MVLLWRPCPEIDWASRPEEGGVSGLLPQLSSVEARSLRCELLSGPILEAAVQTLFVVVLPLPDLLPSRRPDRGISFRSGTHPGSAR
jgi:hypothetical protein